MEPISLDSQDSFDDDSFDENELNQILQDKNDLGTDKLISYEYKEINNNINNNNIIINNSIEKYINYDNIDKFIYPTNLEIRDYQLDIIQKSLFENLLCAIPTGLGKTFIASTLMLNYFKWFKSLKIIFMAPTKPLVAQQIKAFIEITGISMLYTDILLDKSKKNRKISWDNKRIFFTTPQVVENDLKSGNLNPNEIILLIIDEAHKARGNYAYTNVINFLNKFNNLFRVLALTATPGSDVESVQSVIENLNISKIEIRTENDLDIIKYIKSKTIEKLDCEQNNEILTIIDMISDAITPILEKANNFGIYDIKDPSKINHFIAMEKSQKVIKNPSLSEGLKWSYYFILQLLGTVGQFFRRLNIYGIKTFYNYFLDKYTEFITKFNNKKSTNKLAASFYFDNKITQVKKYVESLIENDKILSIKNPSHIEGLFSHTKLKYMVDELIDFFNKNKSSSCIIFTEFRESALEIVKVLENSNKAIGKDLIRPHIFIGQSKEKDKFDEQSYLDKIKPKRKKNKNESNESIKPGKDLKKNNDDNRISNRIDSSENAQLKGMNQKTQKELIENFKKGKFNTLVATSIGEEGLDIGEVDLIICFDSTQSPIKNIQRMGRTGRKKDGKVLLLFSSNERSKFESSMGKYEWIQNQIKLNSNNLKYFDGTNNRIIPKSIDPRLVKTFIEIPKENEDLLKDSDIIDTDEFLKLATQTIKLKDKNSAKSLKKRKNSKSDDPRQMKITKNFFMPSNVETGFKPVSSLVTKTIITKSSNTLDTKKNSNLLILDSDDEDDNFLSNIISKNDQSHNEHSASELFSSIIDSSNNNNVDLTCDIDDADSKDEKNLQTNSNKDINNNDILNNNDNSNYSNSVADETLKHNKGLEQKFVLDDDLSDIFLDEIDKNVLEENPENTNFHVDVDSNKKRKLYDLSSDIFSDDIDDQDLISQLNIINKEQHSPSHQQLRPSKRSKS